MVEEDMVGDNMVEEGMIKELIWEKTKEFKFFQRAPPSR